MEKKGQESLIFNSLKTTTLPNYYFITDLFSKLSKFVCRGYNGSVLNY